MRAVQVACGKHHTLALAHCGGRSFVCGAGETFRELQKHVKYVGDLQMCTIRLGHFCQNFGVFCRSLDSRRMPFHLYDLKLADCQDEPQSLVSKLVWSPFCIP